MSSFIKNFQAYKKKFDLIKNIKKLSTSTSTWSELYGRKNIYPIRKALRGWLYVNMRRSLHR